MSSPSPSIAATPKPPYYCVIFTSTRTPGDNGYAAMSVRMAKLATEQPGFLGIESCRDDLGITLSYWNDLESIQNWKANLEHQDAQRRGRERWYADFKIRIAKVERDYGK